MTDYLFTAILPHENGLAQDRFVNTFAVKDLIPGGAARGAVAGAIGDFYDTVPTGGLTSIGALLSGDVDRDALACQILVYDITAHLDGSAHGAPVDAFTFTMPAASSVVRLPQEVAFVLTLESDTRNEEPVEVPDDGDPDAVPQRPMQRHTGRIFLGPFNDDALNATNGRPDATIRDTARLAAADLAPAIRAETIGGTGDEGWSVWSRKDEILRPIFTVATDDAFDTQRRRGVDPTARVRLAV